jgi:hypothetical protein
MAGEFFDHEPSIEEAKGTASIAVVRPAGAT